MQSNMYTFDDAGEGSPNDFIIELSTKQGWNNDTAEELADFLNELVDNGTEVYYMGSFSDDEGGSVLQIRVDQYLVSNPIDRENFRPYIQQGIDAIFGESESNDAERAYGDYVDNAMMDHYDMMNGDIGDFESVEFYKDVKTLCDIAGQPALAEAVIKLHKAYQPVMEAVGVPVQIFADYLNKKGIHELDINTLNEVLGELVNGKRLTSAEAEEIRSTIMNGAHPNMEAAENAHKVPREIAVAFNDYIADTLYTRPEYHDQLKASEFEPNWNWLDDNAEYVIKVWNATHDPSEIKRLLDNLDEEAACWNDGI